MREDYFHARMRALRRELRKHRITHYLVTHLTNVRYLSGFSGTNGILFVTPEETIFFSDGRYEEQSRDEVVGCRILIIKGGPFLRGVAAEIRRTGCRRFGFEGYDVTVATYRLLERLVGRRTKLVFSPDVLSSLRSVKDDLELAALRKGARVVDRAFSEIQKELREGITEAEIQKRLDAFMMDHGARAPSFPSIVLFGARASLPHGKPGSTRLRKGDWVLMDYGARVDGYCSDFTRTLVFGKATSRMKRLYQLVRRAQAAGIGTMKPGVKMSTVDREARAVIEAGGHGPHFGHALGHGVGLEVHEEPRLSFTARGYLRTGHLYTVEPGLYIPGWGGIRIEDMVLVTPKGSSRLTRSTRKLIEI